MDTTHRHRVTWPFPRVDVSRAHVALYISGVHFVTNGLPYSRLQQLVQLAPKMDADKSPLVSGMPPPPPYNEARPAPQGVGGESARMDGLSIRVLSAGCR